MSLNTQNQKFLHVHVAPYLIDEAMVNTLGPVLQIGNLMGAVKHSVTARPWHGLFQLGIIIDDDQQDNPEEWQQTERYINNVLQLAGAKLHPIPDDLKEQLEKEDASASAERAKTAN